jgi:hypothetical protein
MGSAIETRLHLAESSWFKATVSEWPCDIGEHRYCEQREYPTHAAAMEAILKPGFFNPAQGGGIRVGDMIQVRIGRQPENVWLATLIVTRDVREAPIETLLIGDVAAPHGQ